MTLEAKPPLCSRRLRRCETFEAVADAMLAG
jgi:hypothetical protein